MRFRVVHLLLLMAIVALAVAIRAYLPLIAIAVGICAVAYGLQQAFFSVADNVGIDFVYVANAVEKQFGVRLDGDDLAPLFLADNHFDCTAEEFHQFICEHCRKHEVTVPRSSWNRTKLALSESLGVRPSEVRKDAWLQKDLGM